MGLKRVRNDLFGLAGLVEAHHTLGHDKEAREAMARLLFVTSDADKGLAVLERTKALGVKAEPKDSSPAPQRNYARFTLSKYGPPLWAPYEAPNLDAVDHENKTSSLGEYRARM